MFPLRLAHPADARAHSDVSLSCQKQPQAGSEFRDLSLLILALRVRVQADQVRGNPFQPTLTPKIKTGTITSDAAAFANRVFQQNRILHCPNGAGSIFQADLLDSPEHAHTPPAVLPHFRHKTQAAMFSFSIQGAADFSLGLYFHKFARLQSEYLVHSFDFRWAVYQLVTYRCTRREQLSPRFAASASKPVLVEIVAELNKHGENPRILLRRAQQIGSLTI